MKKKTLLLVFVHGFQGDDDTFGEFPSHLQATLRHSIPHIEVVSKIFPRYETRGQLVIAVNKLRSWLQDLVIELETRNGTKHPTIKPSVRTILVCHSMGGIVSADVLLSILDEPTVSGKGKRTMFPYIQGLLAFDTPYLGLAPSMFSHNVDSNLKTASAVISSFASLTSLFATKKATDEVNNTSINDNKSIVRQIPPEGAGPTTAEKRKKAATTDDAPATPTWSSWSKLALFAGAAGAVAAGGAAAYFKREEVSQGFGWATSHIEFVRELAQAETLRKRLTRVSAVDGVGFANFYTSLGLRKANSMSISGANDATSLFLNKERTFCSEPGKGSDFERFWFKMVNRKAKDEIEAHTGMFSPTTNPGFYEMSMKARDLVVEWAEGWK
ncbi:hypothetical protein BDZ91DRAFT_681608 [Kalaharituber pfeilii]|nr:hypothetical protein BDZ91DRAFT_681608 [Kalaharituber pfeilii]